MEWSKRLKSLTEKEEFSPHSLPISGQSPKETLGTSWHWQVGINPWQVSAINNRKSPRNHRAGLLTCFAQGISFIHKKTPGFLASGGEEFNPGPEMRLDRSELLSNKMLLKYKGDKESFWHRHQMGAERALASVSNGVIYSSISCYSESKECLEVVKTSLDLFP